MGSAAAFDAIVFELLARGNAVRFSAPGLSMHPTIRDGETIQVEPIRVDQIRRGDILLHRWERGVRAHRVVRIAGDGRVLILRPDARGDDERIRLDQVLGRVVSLDRDGRLVRLRGPAAFARGALGRSASRMNGLKTYLASRLELVSLLGAVGVFSGRLGEEK